jgi:hypothetical protein
LYKNYSRVIAFRLPYSWLWGKDRNVGQGDDGDGGPTLLRKSHPIWMFAPIDSSIDDSEDSVLVPGMMTNEMAQDISPDIAGCARFRS